MTHAPEITLAGWMHLVAFGLLLPALVLRNARGISKRTMPLPQRVTHFRSQTVVLATFAGTSLLVASVGDDGCERFGAARAFE